MTYFTSNMFRFIRPAMVIVAVMALSTMVGCATGPDRSAKTPAATAGAADGPTRITGISTSEAPDRVDVLIESSRPLTYTSVKQPSPLGVVLYFPKTELENLQPRYPVGKGPVDSIQTTGASAGAPVSRIQIELKQDVPYDVAQHDGGLRVSFPKSMASAGAPAGETVFMR